MKTRWVSVLYPEPPKDEGGASSQSFPVYYNESVGLEDEYPAVRVFCDQQQVAAIFNALSVHLCKEEDALPPLEGPDA